jgi:hypothetical protein
MPITWNIESIIDFDLHAETTSATPAKRSTHPGSFCLLLVKRQSIS